MALEVILFILLIFSIELSKRAVKRSDEKGLTYENDLEVYDKVEHRINKVQRLEKLIRDVVKLLEFVQGLSPRDEYELLEREFNLSKYECILEKLKESSSNLMQGEAYESYEHEILSLEADKTKLLDCVIHLCMSFPDLSTVDIEDIIQPLLREIKELQTKFSVLNSLQLEVSLVNDSWDFFTCDLLLLKRNEFVKIVRKLLETETDRSRIITYKRLLKFKKRVRFDSLVGIAPENEFEIKNREIFMELEDDVKVLKSFLYNLKYPIINRMRTQINGSISIKDLDLVHSEDELKVMHTNLIGKIVLFKVNHSDVDTTEVDYIIESTWNSYIACSDIVIRFNAILELMSEAELSFTTKYMISYSSAIIESIKVRIDKYIEKYRESSKEKRRFPTLEQLIFRKLTALDNRIKDHKSASNPVNR
eukprot:NODE_221_length_13987_cov_0.244888.p3 type:complete len:421 gc:universal NODE_221_length_13987_cov_0.244888:6796-8058(+)